MLTVAVTANEKEGKTAVNSDNTATVALSGTVLDSNSGELLVGVEVQIEGTETKTYTDFDGNFTFDNMKPGEYKLVANYISYKKCTETLKVDGKENQVKIKLEN
jgi:protocatechuate 3,4-dioxygenase beta subunit